MVNQTTEILIGISEQTGMQFNELLNMTSNFLVFKHSLDLLGLVLIVIVLGFVGFKLYRRVDFESDPYMSDGMEILVNVLLPCLLLFILLAVVFVCFEECVLGIMFPKECMIQGIIDSIL